MRKFIALLFAVTVVSMSFAHAGQLRIGYLCNNLNDTFQTYIVDAAESAAKAAGAAIEVMDGQEDVIRQQDQVNTLIENGVDALIVVPVNTSAVEPIVEAAANAKLPLIFVNRNPFTEVAPPANVYFVGADETLMGRTQMEHIGELMGGSGNICILMGMLSNEASISRTNGVQEVIKEKFPNINVLAEETANWQRDQGINVTENWLTAYGDQINAIVSNNDEMALGAVMALHNAGIKDVFVIGVDATADGRQAVKEGEMTATVLQDPIGQGKGSVDMVIKIKNGETVEAITKLPAVLITKDNADS